MASVKIASLFIKTISKPIANKLKQQAQEHESFRRICISLAQGMHQTEVKLRTNVMGESRSSIRPLNDNKAITNGATALAEGFLFFVGVSLVVGEAWRSSRSNSKRRDDVDDRLGELRDGLEECRKGMLELQEGEVGKLRRQEEKLERLESILDQVISIGLRGGWLDPSSLPSPTLATSLPSSSLSSSSPSSSPPPSSSSSSFSSTSPASPASDSSAAPDALSTRESQILPFVQLKQQAWARPSLSAPPPPLFKATPDCAGPDAELQLA